MKNKLANIPTNIITGFLGSGKTTAILHLLKHKPSNENWAVLVNEFGEIGIDGALITASLGNNNKVFIREVPGGCMCCAAGVPMQVALNSLIKASRPDRLLIEPTGLGHPKEVLSVLSSSQYQSLLRLQSTITLVDARHIQDSRYTEHETFIQQLEIADIIVANKADTYQATEFDQLSHYLEKQFPDKKSPLYQTQFAALQQTWLATTASANLADFSFHSHHHQQSELSIPECGYLTVQNEGEGFFSQGWIFENQLKFDLNKLTALIENLDVERIKAVINITDATIIINKADQVQLEQRPQSTLQSRIEVIAKHKNKLQEIHDTLTQLSGLGDFNAAVNFPLR